MVTDKKHNFSPSIRLLLTIVLIDSVLGDLRIEEVSNSVNVSTKSSSGRYTVTMDENNHSWDKNLTPLFKIVTSSDLITNWLTFNRNSFKYSYDQKASVFYADQSFDYETQPIKYSFQISSKEDFIDVDFIINNIDDEDPSLTSPNCIMKEMELYTASDSPCSCLLHDPDGWLDKTTFKLWEVADTPKLIDNFEIVFKEAPTDDIHDANVYIINHDKLKYDDKTFYIFDIEAHDSAGHNTTPPMVRGLINVKNIRHTNPIWTKPITSATVTEKKVETIEVAARDGDSGIGATVHYKITHQDLPEENYVSLASDINGEITINKIDRDKYDLSTFNFSVTAFVFDEGKSWETPLNVALFVNDIDDNPPLFRRMVNTSDPNKVVIFKDHEPKQLSIRFLENYNESFHMNLFLQDIDTGENAQFDVELVNTNDTFPFTDAFLIIPNKGYRSGIFDISVQNKKHLDYEDPDWRSLSFEVRVKGTKDNNKADTLLVEVDLIDYNDELPIFDKPEYEVEINETAPKGFEIIKVMATDRDAEDHILKHVLVGSSNVLALLDIDSATGMISVKIDNAFDYDKLNPVFVQVQAIDKVNHKTTVPVTIKLLDVNNKAPIITNDEAISVEENQAIGMTLQASITATDPDTNPNLVANIDWENSYALKNSGRLNMSDPAIAQRVKFLDLQYKSSHSAVDEKQISILLSITNTNQNNTTPDYELFDILRLSIVVTDENTDPAFLDKKSTSASIMISIDDINDNTPYFPEPFYLKPINRTAQEGVTPGTTVGTLKAYDLDVKDKLSFTCQAEHQNFDWITVEASSGEITVKEAAKINADTPPTYYFNYTCYVDDTIHTSKGLFVSVYILDTNNETPVLDNLDDNTELKVLEKSAKDTEILEIKCSDADRDVPFHTVVCNIVEGISEATGKCNQEFYIQKNIIKVKRDKQLDRDLGDKYYNCSAECTDNPGKDSTDERQNTVPRTFSIKLLDINDHDPLLIKPKADILKKGIQVSEKQLKDDTLVELEGYDPDEGPNGAIEFSITETITIDLFEIEGLSDKAANLKAKQDLKDHYGKHEVKFVLRDHGTERRQTENVTIIEITKFNFEPPRFIYPTSDESETLLSDQELNKPLRKFYDTTTLENFYASDSIHNDKCTKWDITMDMKQKKPEVLQTMFQLIRINKCEYQLQINGNYKKEDAVANKFEIELTARVKNGVEMEGEKPYTTTTTIALSFTNNEQQPIFTKSSFDFSFVEGDLKQRTDLKVKAEYAGGISREVFYYIVDDKKNPALEYFEVNSNTGEITLKQELEYLKYKKYEFQILASNDTNPSTSLDPKSRLAVTCNVEEINKYPPVFNKHIYYGALLTTSQSGAVLVTLSATDRDEMDKANLTYSIFGTIENVGSTIANIQNPFKIDSNNGEISLNFTIDDGMSGYFKFQVMVKDLPDRFGNGPHNTTASCIIFIITAEYTVRFRFMNTLEQVRKNEDKMLDVINGILGIAPNVQSKGADGQGQAFASLYFIESKSKLMRGKSTSDLGVSILKGSEILRKVGDIGTYRRLYQEIYTRASLTLLSFPSDSTDDDLDSTVKNWLIGVAVVLGILCLALLAAFIFKTRQLKNTISRLTETGSSDAVEKLDIAAPNTNKNAMEGSNPMFSSETTKRPKDENDFEIGDYDKKSVVSGDSDLIGVEENPEFDLAFSEGINEAKNYI